MGSSCCAIGSSSVVSFHRHTSRQVRPSPYLQAAIYKPSCCLMIARPSAGDRSYATTNASVQAPGHCWGHSHMITMSRIDNPVGPLWTSRQGIWVGGPKLSVTPKARRRRRITIVPSLTPPLNGHPVLVAGRRGAKECAGRFGRQPTSLRSPMRYVTRTAPRRGQDFVDAIFAK
ncbi:hypothetical protein VUR80DRAFT_9798 [Thermomyces stellatus]